MTHIATTNYQFCAGLKDSEPPALPNTTDKDAIVKFLNDSFAYCATVIPSLTEEQIGEPHNSPDGRLPPCKSTSRIIAGKRKSICE